MMFRDGYDIARACLLEQRRPRCGVESFSCEEWDKVFVPEAGLRSKGFDVVLEFFRAFQIHLARIPFVTEGGNRIDAPMNEYPEFRIPVPLGHAIAFERF